jgi:hypothetical protein
MPVIDLLTGVSSAALAQPLVVRRTDANTTPKTGL